MEVIKAFLHGITIWTTFIVLTGICPEQTSDGDMHGENMTDEVLVSLKQCCSALLTYTCTITHP